MAGSINNLCLKAPPAVPLALLTFPTGTFGTKKNNNMTGNIGAFIE